MTRIDRIDPLDRRVVEALEEIASPQRPDYLDDIFRQTARLSQRSRWMPDLKGYQPMNRLTYAAAAAVLVAVIAGGVIFLRPSANVGPPATPSPSPTTAATASAVVSQSLRATWLAGLGAAPSGDTAALSRLTFTASGDGLEVVDALGASTFPSQPVAGASDELDIQSTGVAGGCGIGDLGRYRFAFGGDGTLPGTDGTRLGLTVIADACPARSAALSRSWAHAIDANSVGGRGIATAFRPWLLITLPAATYTGGVDPDTFSVASTTPDRTLIVVRDPIGWTVPCAADGGAKRPVVPTIAAFTAYMRSLPGFTVQSASLTIGGHPAVLLTVPSVATPECSSHKVLEWTTSDPTNTGGWNLRQGDTDILYLVQVNGDLILMQWLGTGVTRTEEQAVLATVRFTDTLPGS